MFKFEDFKNPEIEGFIAEYGYGSCHLLSQFISEKYNLEIGLIKSDPSGMPIHSFVFLNNEYAFDAHGIDKVEETIKRYESFSAEYEDTDIQVDRLSVEEGPRVLSHWSYAEDDELDFMKKEFEHLDNLTNINEKICLIINTPLVKETLMELLERKLIHSDLFESGSNLKPKIKLKP